MIFAIFDYFTKESPYPIPNGFNMSMTEYDSYRLNTTGHMSSRSFNYPDFYDTSKVIPIPLQSYLSNPRFFDNRGEIYYVISLSKTTRYYNFLFMSGMNSWLNFLNPDLITLVKLGKVKLVLQIFIETTFKQDFAEIFYYTEQQLGSVDNFEVWTCFGMPNIEFCDSWWHTSYAHRLVDYPFYEKKVLEMNKNSNNNLQKTKKYVSLCRRYTRERLICHAYLIKHNLLDLGYNSIPAIDVVDSSKPDLQTSLKNILKPAIFTDCVDSAVKYYDENSQGFILDIEQALLTDQELYNTSANMGFNSDPDLEPYYKSSYISVIQEGDIAVNNFMITEKTYRAILYKHLFVMIGPPFLLAALRERGYKTFSKLWDESYDAILDEDMRIKTALDLFKDIITSSDLHNLYEQAQDILEHNYNLLHKRAEQKELYHD